MSNTNDTNAPGRLSLVELTKTFSNTVSDVTAVDHINLDIRPGEFITLLGPSGCGKTTTLRMIAGFEDATSGQVMLDGENMVVVPPNRRPMSMVFQSYALFPHLSVRENVAYGLRLRKKSAEEIKEEVDIALAAMNLTAMADRAPSQLSGGQQQRVALARAMSPCRTWMRSCASRCAWRSAGCKSVWVSLPSTSPTISLKLWQCRTASSS